MNVFQTISATAEKLTGTAERLYHQIVPSSIPLTESQQLAVSIEKARTDLARAEAVFNELTEDSAIDFAAYEILAARAKYSHLIKLAKEQNLHL